MTSLGFTCRHGRWLHRVFQSAQNSPNSCLKFTPRSVSVSEWKPITAFSYHTSTANPIFKTFNENSAESVKDAKSKNDKSKDATEGDSAEATVDKSDFDQLEKDMAEQKAKTDEIMDKYRRSIAENDNMRKRLTKQIEDAKIFGIQGFCKDLLDVADVLTKAVDAGQLIEKEPGNQDMVEGVKLTQTQLLQVFKRHGLAQISPVIGEEKFDPNLHEAMFQIPAPDMDENIVLDVQKIGYSLHGRTIRPALVGVSKK